ncbi:hypothetical protein PSHT_06637 [Puccinia striiformis]|uniref:Uncharacterized protein n=1 Tax=Puccinia striiformis TaxID=27350 RepID=A0A2S4W4G9_9BASI|nr:hypothetical protein PSHT_06637 [Puccinia striiformis]
MVTLMTALEVTKSRCVVISEANQVSRAKPITISGSRTIAFKPTLPRRAASSGAPSPLFINQQCLPSSNATRWNLSIQFSPTTYSSHYFLQPVSYPSSSLVTHL